LSDILDDIGRQKRQRQNPCNIGMVNLMALGKLAVRTRPPRLQIVEPNMSPGDQRKRVMMA
jgi:hypothetical protein